jgi:hypothetical protein
MKHHFGDALDRSGGHWNFVPNVERYAYHMPEWTEGQKQISIATISAEDQNWELIATFPNLVELTLHSPSHEQLAFVSQLWRLKRLRITHARPKNIEHLARLQSLEEIILEYVSGFSDLSPLSELANLTALHLENLRRVSDFSGLKNAKKLKYLSLDGTLDWDQPVESFEFLGGLSDLEFLRIMKVRTPKVGNPLESLLKLKCLKNLSFSANAFPVEIFAWIAAKLSHVDGADRSPFVKYGGENREIRQGDLRNRMPIEEFIKSSSLSIGVDGKRYEWVPYQAMLLGRGQRWVTGSKESVDKACEKHARRYQELITSFS